MSIVLEKIKAIRKKRGLSQDDIAQYLGVEVSTYGKVERGVIELNVERLERIAEFFGYSVPEVYNYSDEEKPIKKDSNQFNATQEALPYEVSVTIKVNDISKEQEILKLIGLK